MHAASRWIGGRVSPSSSASLVHRTFPSPRLFVPRVGIQVGSVGCRSMATSEGGAPFRYPLDWGSEEFYDKEDLEKEMRRQFDVCHGCRRCFNLCDSFPELFKLIDESHTGELDSVPSSEFKHVVDQCTLCDMCFVNKCPYVPPHSHNIDFPHLMLRYRAVENEKANRIAASDVSGIQSRHPDNKGDETDFTNRVKDGVSRELKLSPTPLVDRLLTNIDRLSPIISRFSGIYNALSKPGSSFRNIIAPILGIHKDAALPTFVSSSSVVQSHASNTPTIDNTDGHDVPSKTRKVLLYMNCNPKWNNPSIVHAAESVLSHHGVRVKKVYPMCCGMPQLEQGSLSDVKTAARQVSAAVVDDIRGGWDLVALVPSCALMLKQEYLSVLPEDENVRLLSENSFDISEYIMDIHKKEGLNLEGLSPLEGPISLHQACHSRALNVGAKAKEMLSLIPDADVVMHEACSGHGGSWGVKQPHYPTAMKVGKRLFRRLARDFKVVEDEPVAKYVVSECPLAGDHILQGLREEFDGDQHGQVPTRWVHPIELFAHAHGLTQHRHLNDAQ